MIVLTTLRGKQQAINDELIERVEDDNETRVVLTNGARYIVAESVDEVVRRMRQHRAEVQALSQQLIAETRSSGRDLAHEPIPGDTSSAGSREGREHDEGGSRHDIGGDGT